MFMYREYEKLLEDLYPDINGHDLAVEVDKHFATWFENHVRVKLVLLLLFSFAKRSYIINPLLSYIYTGT
jgi:hypothetical protein